MRRIDPTAAGARQIRELAPESVGRLVLRRIAPLGPHSRAVAEAVAVLGDDAELSRTAELADLGRADAARSVSALRGMDVLSPDDPPAFTHPLVRRAIYDDMDIARREALHATAAEMLAAAGAAPSRIARHLVAVGPRGDEAVATALRAAAREAMAQSAPDAAATYLARALEEPPADADSDAVTLALGLAQTRASPADAVPHLMQVIDSTEDDALLAEAVIALTAAPREGYGEWTSIALDVMDRITDEKPRKRIQAHYALFGGYRPDEFPMVMRLLGAIDVREGSRDPVDLVLLALKASLAAREGAQPEDALALARAALADEVLVAYDCGAFGLTFSVVLHLDLFDEAMRIAEDAIALARRAGLLPAFMFGTLLKAMVLLGRGDLAGAETEMPIAVDPNPVRLSGMRPGSQTLGQIALYRGDLLAAAEHLDYPEEREERGSWGSAINRGRRGVLRAAQGRLDAGLDDLRTAGAWLTTLGGRNPAFFPWRSEAALVLARLRRRDEALELVSEEVQLARLWGAPRALGVQCRTRHRRRRRHRPAGRGGRCARGLSRRARARTRVDRARRRAPPLQSPRRRPRSAGHRPRARRALRCGRARRARARGAHRRRCPPPPRRPQQGLGRPEPRAHLHDVRRIELRLRLARRPCDLRAGGDHEPAAPVVEGQ